ncbi:MAG TPA: hypothetical protein VMJ73_16165 [Rhizomicrobium sp.]|nr:hypothetical protein [Rhizomicrobium sp.]
MNIRKTILALVIGSVATTGFVASASADTIWQKHHPRREEVNGRLANLNRRIHEERVEGDLTGKQALALHRDVRGIRHQERFAASLDNGHITKAEQRGLNQEENAVSGQVGR